MFIRNRKGLEKNKKDNKRHKTGFVKGMIVVPKTNKQTNKR